MQLTEKTGLSWTIFKVAISRSLVIRLYAIGINVKLIPFKQNMKNARWTNGHG